MSSQRHIARLLSLAALAAGMASDRTAKAEEAPSPVIAVVAEKTDGVLREFRLTGTVSAKREARLSSRTDGLVAEVLVDEGSLVKPGEVIATLDTKLATIQLEMIRAEIAQAEVELAEATRREEEVREISQTGGFAKSEADTRKTAVRIREAALRRLQVRAEEQSELIERHRLIAPFGGVISEKIAEAGEWVETGTPVAQLVETENVRFDLQVPQEFLARISKVEKITVVLDSFPNKPLNATVQVMVPVKDTVSRTFLTRLTLEDPEKLAAPGMSGTAIAGYRTDQVASVRIPRDAVVRFPDGTAKVWIVVGEGGAEKVASRLVRTGGTLGDFTEIVEGLSGGERVVLKGNEGLREDQAVEASLEQGAGPSAEAE